MVSRIIINLKNEKNKKAKKIRKAIAISKYYRISKIMIFFFFFFFIKTFFSLTTKTINVYKSIFFKKI